MINGATVRQRDSRRWGAKASSYSADTSIALKPFFFPCVYSYHGGWFVDLDAELRWRWIMLRRSA